MRNVFQKYADKEDAEYALDSKVDALVKHFGRRSPEVEEVLLIVEATKAGVKKTSEAYAIKSFSQVETYIEDNFPIS